jgi:DNA repair protein RadA/Sms
MICALLTKYSGANFSERDVYLNVAGGLKIDDSSLDLSLCIALLSSYYDKEISPGKVAIGEVSLTGQVIPTGDVAEKVKAVKRLGYDTIVVPKGSVKQTKQIIGIDSISQLKKLLD